MLHRHAVQLQWRLALALGRSLNVMRLDASVASCRQARLARGMLCPKLVAYYYKCVSDLIVEQATGRTGWCVPGEA
jgi:hypothetical protein